MLLSMRARARGAFWRNEPNRHFGRTKPSGELGVFGPSEAPTFGCRKRPRAQFHCFRPVLYNDFLQLARVGRTERARFPRQHSRRRGRGAAVTFERRIVHPSRTARRRAKRGWSRRRSSCAGRVQLDSYPRMLVMKVAPLLRRQRKSSQQVVRSSFAFRAGGWLRLSRPTQSLMTLA